MNENPLSEQNHFKKDDTSNQGAWHDHCPSPGAVSPKVPNNQGNISIQIPWGIMHVFQQRIMCHQENILTVLQHNTMAVTTPYTLRAWT